MQFNKAGYKNYRTNYASVVFLVGPYFLRYFSTRPAVSTIFCVPVKNGWHKEHISTFISGTVDLVVNKTPRFSPQLQITLHL